MIEINGIRYAKNDKEFNNTLFQIGGTASGFYKVLKNRIELMDQHKEPFACIGVNDAQGVSIVNMGKINGKKFYQYGLSDHHADTLGMPNGYIAGIEYSEWLYKKCLNEHHTK